MAGALLPENYERARAALAELVEIDACKDWADRAEALRSYAKQADDPTLLNHAMRIKVRAVRQCGELLQALPTVQGARTDVVKLITGTGDKLDRRRAAEDVQTRQLPFRKR